MTPSTTSIRWPTTPFTRGDATALGVSASDLRRGLRRGEIRSPLRGVFVPAGATDSIELRAQCAAKIARPHHVLTDRSAAWIHGIDVLVAGELHTIPPLETCALRGHRPTSLDGVDGRTRDLLPEDIVVLHGLRVTHPLRTALDLGCCLRRREAYAALNAFARRFGLTRTDYLRSLGRYRGRRGVIQLRALVALVDPRLESQRESWVLLEIADAGLPLPEPQVWVDRDPTRRYRLDFAYRDQRICVEYDGFEAHERTDDQRRHDRERRRWLRENGWTVIVIRCGGFTGSALDQWLRELREALRAAAMSSYSNRRW